MFAVVDVETTGLWPGLAHRVVELAIVQLDNERQVQREWSTLINPGRDLGPVGIHGVTGAMVANAPHFDEIVGDVIELIDGRTLVAHNARFDMAFLDAEFARAGIEVELSAICTMTLAGALGQGRSLADCCERFGFTIIDAHTALGDARATARLLAGLLPELERRSLAPKSFPLIAGLPARPPCRSCLSRTEAGIASRPRSYVAQLVGSLPRQAFALDVDPEVALAYAGLLDRALEDRVITNVEANDLLDAASAWELSLDALAAIHTSYLTGLVAVALADGIITAAERRDLERVADLLGIPRDQLDAFTVLQHASPWPSAAGTHDLAGCSVCFTGESVCSVRGIKIDRADAEVLAAQAGLSAARNVTKKLDILVVADPDSLSGKARKAREYGTRIIAEPVFWRMLGVDID